MPQRSSSRPAHLKQRSVSISSSSSKGKRLSAYRRNCKAISDLETELATKLLLAEKLKSEQSRLQTEHQLLPECCEGLQLLRQTNTAQGRGAAAAAAAVAAGTAGYDAEELALLQQLQSIPYNRPSASAAPLNGCSIPDSSGCFSGNDVHPSLATAGSDAAAAAADATAEPTTESDAAAQQFGDMYMSPPDDVMPRYPGADTLTAEELSTR